MNLIAHSIRSKGGVAFVRRIGSVGWRFRPGSSNAERNLGIYLSTLRHHGCSATFPITAVVLRRHRDLARFLHDEGVELAVHGYVHTDHTTLPADKQREQFARALDIFASAGIPVDGLRCPYLRSNEDTVLAAQDLGFRYVSNETIAYDVLDEASHPPARWREYQKALDLYSARSIQQSVARPRLRGGLVEIPVSMPDDEILVDRLGIHEGQMIGHLWVKLLDQTYVAGDVLTVQIHPERGRICREALNHLLSAARRKSPPVWIAQLRDLAAWWQRRARFQLEVEPRGEGSWQVAAGADRDATILVKNVVGPALREWFGSYAALDGLVGVVRSPVCPVIGASPRSTELAAFLREEGYAVREGADPTDCAVYFDRPGPLSPPDQASILNELERCQAPLIRLSRWPDGNRSALAITGDIDALSLWDFFSRAWEVL